MPTSADFFLASEFVIGFIGIEQQSNGFMFVSGSRIQSAASESTNRQSCAAFAANALVGTSVEVLCFRLQLFYTIY